jgi:16S rRNA (uracil1498-N3)-methyltransferase
MAIEAGVARVVPVVCQYGDVKELERLQKSERWKRIAQEAIEQSGNMVYNRVDPAISMACFLSTSPAALEIVCHPPYLWQGLPNVLALTKEQLQQAKRVRLFVGPEGGFADAEIELLEQRGAVFYGFGSTILRTEHAGLYALGAINILTQDEGVKKLDGK